MPWYQSTSYCNSDRPSATLLSSWNQLRLQVVSDPQPDNARGIMVKYTEHTYQLPEDFPEFAGSQGKHRFSILKVRCRYETQGVLRRFHATMLRQDYRPFSSSRLPLVLLLKYMYILFVTCTVIIYWMPTYTSTFRLSFWRVLCLWRRLLPVADVRYPSDVDSSRVSVSREGSTSRQHRQQDRDGVPALHADHKVAIQSDPYFYRYVRCISVAVSPLYCLQGHF